MATISIWYRQEGRAPEKIDTANTPQQALYLAVEYAIAFGCAEGQHRHGKDKVWFGRRDKEPKESV